MLKSLELLQVGPAEHIGPVSFTDRLNVLTGDNGLGKTLLLDIAWWALTGVWTGRPALPRAESNSSSPARIEATVAGKAKDAQVSGTYDFPTQSWSHAPGRPPMPGLVLYFRVDGRFSLWDPAQHYWRRQRQAGADGGTAGALHFSPAEPWDAVRSDDGRVICRGLIEDWVSWQQTNAPEFELLRRVLAELSPSRTEILRPGEPTRVWLDDVRLYPTLELPYGVVPVTLASAAVQRIVLIAYLMVWAWKEHRAAAEILRQEPERRLVVLFDEPETHLHPQWQRRILPSLLHVVQTLQEEMDVQVLVSTHSPLVLASLEPQFDARHDRLFHFWMNGDGKVALDPTVFSARGDVTNWLVSETFGLEQARSVEGERAVEAAEAFMAGRSAANPPGLTTRDEIHEELKRVLPDTDPFWPRWIVTTGAR
jgi:hypothetical protein